MMLMMRGWSLATGAGVSKFGCTLCPPLGVKADRLSLGRQHFAKMRDAGWIKYANPPATAILTARGTRAAQKMALTLD